MKSILSLIISGALVVSGFGQTRNVLVGTNNAVIQPTNFWSADAANARAGLGLGTAATNPATAFQASSSILSNLATSNGGSLTNLQATNLVGVIPASNISTVTFTNIGGTLSLAQGGTGATNAATARTNLGLGWSALTNTDATNFRNAIGLGVTNNVTFGDLSFNNGGGFSSSGNFVSIFDINNSTSLFLGTNSIQFFKPITFNNDSNRSSSRSNLGLSWSGLTNTNAATFQAALFGSNTNPVLVNTNGMVVSPTNFWQAAPISTVFQEIQPTTNATTVASNARFLHLHSLTLSITGVTSTIALPTNNVFAGDEATIVHQGPTNSTTAVRTQGASTNLITINRYDEAVNFVYYQGSWRLNHNLSFVEPVYFSGTNAAANAAASRTNLGLGATNDVVFNSAVYGNELTVNNAQIAGWTTTIDFEEGRWIYTNYGAVDIFNWGTSNKLFVGLPIEFPNLTNAAITRTNLGLPLAALTNTNNANFQAAVFTTNAAPTNTANVNAVNFNTAVHWLEITVPISGTNTTLRIPLFK